MCETSFETILAEIGGMGVWQMQTIAWLSVAILLSGMHNLASVFLATAPVYACTDGAGNTTAVESQHWTLCGGGGGDSSHDRILDGLRCVGGYRYRQESDVSVASEWRLVCERRWLLPLVQSSFMLGCVFGVVGGGLWSDAYGRRNAILGSAFLFAASSVCVSLAPNYYVFIALRFLAAVTISSLYTVMFTLCVEIVAPVWRGRVGILFAVPFALGLIVLPCVAYLVPEWRHLQAVISAPTLLFVAYYWTVCESPRWLILKQKCERVVHVCERVAACNARVCADGRISAMVMEQCRRVELQARDNSGGGSSDCGPAARPQSLLRLNIASYVNWFAVALVYYGTTLDGTLLSASTHLSILLHGLLELPAYLLAVALAHSHSRRACVIGTQLGAALPACLLPYTPAASAWTHFCLSAVSKFSATICFAVLFVYSAEYYPTTQRTCCLGFCSMCARLGSALAPFVVYQLSPLHWALPSLTFAACAFVAALASLALPETKHRRLPDTQCDVAAVTSSSDSAVTSHKSCTQL